MASPEESALKIARLEAQLRQMEAERDAYQQAAKSNGDMLIELREGLRALLEKSE